MGSIRRRCMMCILALAIVLSAIMIPDIRTEAAAGEIDPIKNYMESSIRDESYIHFYYTPSEKESRVVASVIAPTGEVKQIFLNGSGKRQRCFIKVIMYIAGTYSVRLQEQVRTISGGWMDSSVMAVVGIKVTGRKNGWAKTNGQWCYYNSDGVRQYGWKKMNGKWYYLDELWENIYTGWQKIKGKWYYFTASGQAVVGWMRSGANWYHFNTGCWMDTGWKLIDGKWYYFKTDGAMVKNWKLISGKWYYFGSDGIMKSGWILISNKWYYLKDGAAVMGGTITIDGKVYRFDKNGALVK